MASSSIIERLHEVNKIQFVPSKTKKVQGSFSTVQREFPPQLGFSIRELGEGYGNWLVTCRSDALYNGRSLRNGILNHLNAKKLTENMVLKTNNDLLAGKITVEELIKINY